MATDTAGRTLPAFALPAMDGRERAFPTGRPALLAFVKEDCPTCVLTMPLLARAEQAFAGAPIDVLIVGQEAAGNRKLAEQFGTRPLLDDSSLHVSFAYDLDTVPAIFLAAPDGTALRELVGFHKGDWQALWAELERLAGDDQPVEWDGYPDFRPGCGSKSVEPGIAERLEAEASGSRLRARRIEIPPADDPIEFLYEQGLTDGMPVVPPTPERVLRMLAGTRRDPQDVVAIVPPNMAPATVEKVAINAVMAGCKPEYLPVVIAALEAVCT